MIVEKVKQKHECELALENLAMLGLATAIQGCEGHNDYMSRPVFRDSLASPEALVDWLETQLGLIDKVG